MEATRKRQWNKHRFAVALVSNSCCHVFVVIATATFATTGRKIIERLHSTGSLLWHSGVSNICCHVLTETLRKWLVHQVGRGAEMATISKLSVAVQWHCGSSSCWVRQEGQSNQLASVQ